MTTIRIRPSTAADATRVLDIWRSAVDATHHFLRPDDRAAIEEEVLGFLPAVPLILAVDADDIAIGFLLLDGAHVEALFVDAAWHGSGIGRALVEHAARPQATLTTDVNEQNVTAAGFYERLGFQITGRSDRDGAGRPYPLIHLRRAD